MIFSKIKVIGRGGMGSVWLCEYDNGKRAAVKTLRQEVSCNPEFRELFESEARTLRSMNNDSVVRILGDTFYDENNDYCLPMEFVEGETITQHVKNYGPFREDEALSIMSKILDAMDYVHSCGNIHRDIKPSNIMLRPNGSVCIIDFGIAKDMKYHSGKTIGRVIGTDGYMSPEQANGISVDHRTDIYSLGCVLYFMLSGKDAIVKKSSDFETETAILNDSFPKIQDINPMVSERTQNAILKAVDKNMMKRFQTARDFKSSLCGGSGISGGTSLNDIICVTVGRTNGDIIVPSQYVSGTHMKIDYRTNFFNGQKNSILVLTDDSTNGTGINGRYLHKSSMTIDYEHGVTPMESLPEVYLAGRSELCLDWCEVISKLESKGMAKVVMTPPPAPPVDDKLSVLLSIVCVAIPLVGLILWGHWKVDHPGKSKEAGIMAIIGAVISLFLNIIVRIT